MGHGPVRTIGSIIKTLMPGSVVYPLNSQEPLVVVFLTDDCAIMNTAEVFYSHKIVRYIGEWERDFPINWPAFLSTKNFEINYSPFEKEDYEEGLVVIVLSEDHEMAQVAILVGVDEVNEGWITDDATLIPFSTGERVIPTGVKYAFEEVDEADDEDYEDEESEDDA